MPDNTYVMIADEHDGQDFPSGPFKFFGHAVVPVVQTILEYAYKIGAARVISLGDRGLHKKDSSAEREMANAASFHASTYGASSVPTLFADGNHDLGYLSSEDLNPLLGREQSSHFIDLGDDRLAILNPSVIPANEGRRRGYALDASEIKNFQEGAEGKRLHLVTHFGAHCSDAFNDRRSYDLDHNGPAILDALSESSKVTGTPSYLWGGHFHESRRYDLNGGKCHYLPSVSVAYLGNDRPTGAFAVVTSGAAGVSVAMMSVTVRFNRGGGGFKIPNDAVRVIDNVNALSIR